MNKRDFMVTGGGALLGGAAWLSAAGPAHGAAVESPPAGMAGSLMGDLAAWQALQGESFQTQTALGRPVALILSAVHAQASTGRLTQFTVRLQGPRARPLQAGLHALRHDPVGDVALYLEPVAHGAEITYDAHFSLLA